MKKLGKTLQLLASGLVFAAIAGGPVIAGETTGQYVDDSAITAKVKAALVADSDTKAHEINVKTEKGVVQLNGFVGSDKEMAKAAADAGKVEGVTKVENNLAVKTVDR